MNNVASNLAAAWTTLAQQAVEYTIDAGQRSVLYADAMRKRGNLYLEHGLQGKPPLLKFKHEVVIDGRTLPRPCNYTLLHILPEPAFPIDPGKRPIVIVDPRAGHGPGIGGFKPDSQVGMAMRAGHPVYFVSFSPRPIPGQTLQDVGRAEALFIEKVHALHPGKSPAVIGNCQAGWAVAALAAIRPDIMGPLLLNGAPLSYWAGSDEENPMRYNGGLYGGAWVAAMMADLGGGQFDGSLLVRNFESLNPANTYWNKQYNLYANIDEEEPRYLEFERWWGGYFRMTGEEIESIVENLFVGNKLAKGTIRIGDDIVDLRNIASPVVVFASRGDDITPPAQALNWIIDVWGDEREIVAAGRTIIYMVHESIGHLGIFVGSGVAKKEHDQLMHTLDEIEALPPGLYEMVLEAKSSALKYDTLGYGSYSVKFKTRTMDDLRALDDGRRDERVFSTIAQVSDVYLAAYREWMRPWIRSTVSPASAEVASGFAPDRVERIASSDVNPAMRGLAVVAGQVRAERVPASPDNVFSALEKRQSAYIRKALEAYGRRRDEAVAQWVQAVYGPFGWGAIFPPERTAEAATRDEVLEHLEEVRAELEPRLEAGGFPAGLVRMLLIAFRDKGSIRRRSLRLAAIAGHTTDELVASGKLKKVKAPIDWRGVREEQAKLLALFPDRAVETLPNLFANAGERQLAAAIVGRIMLVDPEVADPHSDIVRKAEEVLGVGFEAAAASSDVPEELMAINLMQTE
jgi:pimeloyl-ACP methyl ester carboxylesterase